MVGYSNQGECGALLMRIEARSIRAIPANLAHMLDRKVKRPEKEKKLIEKLGQDKYDWAFNLQHKNFPSWTEAFDYAYKLGYSRGKDGHSKDSKI